jgi:hypothetical protein
MDAKYKKYSDVWGCCAVAHARSEFGTLSQRAQAARDTALDRMNWIRAMKTIATKTDDYI